MLEPTQADREAAASILWVETLIDDQDAIVQAFAHHRQATEQAIIAWLNDMKHDDTNWPQVIARMIAEGEHHAG